jgi:taurine dioxygenase
MEIHRLHDTFGAEVRGLDLTGPVSQADVEALKAALAEHQLLLFRRDAPIPPERQVEVSGWFGPLAQNGEELWSVLHNDTPAGSERLPFHCDFTYTDSPIKAISLHAIDLPAGGSSTTFVSGVHAWASLPADLQDKLSPLTVHHVHRTSLSGAGLPVFAADHPLRFDHPRVGKPVLLATEYHARRINELPPDESEAMLARLFAHIYRPESIYEHRWRLYDLLIWDNLAVQHARPARTAPSEGVRALQRVALNEVGYAELIERARRQEREAEAAGASL